MQILLSEDLEIYKPIIIVFAKKITLYFLIVIFWITN